MLRNVAAALKIILFFSIQKQSVALSYPNFPAYNATCSNEKVPCLPGLRCNRESNKCLCPNITDTIYDSNKQRCFVLIGERCQRQSTDIDYCLDSSEQEFTMNDSPECVEGAICNSSEICSCPTGLQPTPEQDKCFDPNPKGYGVNCSSNADCDEDKQLTCVQGQCGCDPKDSIYNSHDSWYPRGIHPTSSSNKVPPRSCVKKVGINNTCSNESDRYNNFKNKAFCTKAAHCNGNQCVCDNWYTETSDKQCGLNYGFDCPYSRKSSDFGTTERCSDRFQCTGKMQIEGKKVDMKCNCPNPQYQVYDSTLKKCRGFIGSRCDPHEENECIGQASCVKLGGDGSKIFQCMCKHGYAETKDGKKCDVAYGHTCLTQSGSKVCDTEAKLVCKGFYNGKYTEYKCRCENEVDVYEGDRRQCSKPVGGKCESNEECVKNSICIKHVIKLWKVCLCLYGNIMGTNEACPRTNIF